MVHLSVHFLIVRPNLGVRSRLNLPSRFDFAIVLDKYTRDRIIFEGFQKSHTCKYRMCAMKRALQVKVPLLTTFAGHVIQPC